MNSQATRVFPFLSLITAALLLAASGSAQSLGELVRKQRAQKGPQAKSNRVYTNDNLPGAARLSATSSEAEKKSPPPEYAEKRIPEKLAPFVPSPEVVVLRMLQVAGVKPGDTVYDLGCGDGRIIIMAAQKFGANAVGVELDETLYKQTSDRIRELNLQDKVKVIHGDLMEVNLRPATVVTLYLLTSSNEIVKPNLEKYLRKGARVVSHDFEVRGWEPEKVEPVTEDDQRHHTIYLYRR